MKIVDYETFIRMPAGTIFAPWEPCVFKDRFEVKVDGGEAYTNWEGKTAWCFNGTMPLEPWNTEDMYEGYEGDAEFEVYDGDQNDAASHKWFCVLEDRDIDKLINVLSWAKLGCIGEFEWFHDEMSKINAPLKKFLTLYLGLYDKVKEKTNEQTT